MVDRSGAKSLIKADVDATTKLEVKPRLYRSADQKFKPEILADPIFVNRTGDVRYITVSNPTVYRKSPALAKE